MGWLKPTALFARQNAHERTNDGQNHGNEKVTLLKHDNTSAEHLETIDVHIDNTALQDLTYPLQPTTVEDCDLPFISSAVVRSAHRDLNRTWIVVDNIVYDCTDFALEHPGGETVVRSFAGQDCSWQFWRFHNSTHMKQSGSPLRVGRTAGVKNRFAERPRFVGLRRRDEW